MNPLYFLQQIEKAFPPPRNAHHALLATQYGSEAAGWVDKLTLQVNMGDGTFQAFFLSDEDWEKPCGVLVDEIMALLLQPAPPNTQLSEALGTFNPIDEQRN